MGRLRRHVKNTHMTTDPKDPRADCDPLRIWIWAGCKGQDRTAQEGQADGITTPRTYYKASLQGSAQGWL